MNKLKLQRKQDQTTINDIAEKLKGATNIIIATKDALLQQIFAMEVIKSKTIYVASQAFIDKDKKLDCSKQIKNKHEKDIGYDKVKKEVLAKTIENELKKKSQKEMKSLKTILLTVFLKF